MTGTRLFDLSVSELQAATAAMECLFIWTSITEVQIRDLQMGRISFSHAVVGPAGTATARNRQRRSARSEVLLVEAAP